jgi:hypothetical protein
VVVGRHDGDDLGQRQDGLDLRAVLQRAQGQGGRECEKTE